MNRSSTSLIKLDPERPDPAVISGAAGVLRRGGLVAFPTETVYGLGADALNPSAVARIFRVKGRPPDNPLILHLASAQDLPEVATDIPEKAFQLASLFWPGPLTLVLPRAEKVPKATTGGLDTVAVRVPAHPVAQALIREAAVPVAAPSANRSGCPSPTSARHVLEDLEGQVDLILDGGTCPLGVESTVLDMTREPPVILRPGGVPQETLEAVLGEVRGLSEVPQAARHSPGARYHHYAPRARVLVVGGEETWVRVAELLKAGQKVGVMARRPMALQDPRLIVRPMPRDLAGYAHELFSALRDLDAQGCQVIVAEAVEEEGLGRAIMDRLLRAATRAEPRTQDPGEGNPAYPGRR